MVEAIRLDLQEEILKESADEMEAGSASGENKDGEKFSDTNDVETADV